MFSVSKSSPWLRAPVYWADLGVLSFGSLYKEPGLEFEFDEDLLGATDLDKLPTYNACQESKRVTENIFKDFILISGGGKLFFRRGEDIIYIQNFDQFVWKSLRFLNQAMAFFDTFPFDFEMFFKSLKADFGALSKDICTLAVDGNVWESVKTCLERAQLTQDQSVVGTTITRIMACFKDLKKVIILQKPLLPWKLRQPGHIMELGNGWCGDEVHQGRERSLLHQPYYMSTQLGWGYHDLKNSGEWEDLRVPDMEVMKVRETMEEMMEALRIHRTGRLIDI